MTSYERIVDRVCNRTCDRFCFFDQKIAVEKLTGLKLLAERIEEPQDKVTHGNDQNTATIYVSSMDKFTCQLCSVDFPDTDSMREHFKSDLHVYKMNMSLGKSMNLTDSIPKGMEFANCTPTTTKSTSKFYESSQTDSTAESCPSLAASSHKQMVYFRSRSGEIIGIHRCILFTRKVSTSLHL
ncbi:unnamed protein product [Echinostoma caproni]|uniref:C2H2-type domain-containing protein n=1 Tax=Echinostoma caproni TaxID=27848 RepID=A0A183BC27_9TREM|nr:unnamed protein product [Echinostoma caproni]